MRRKIVEKIKQEKEKINEKEKENKKNQNGRKMEIK